MTLSPLTLFRCMRHRRGFGIHSPFAFRFVTEVLAQRLPYYGYTDISGDPRIRLLFRLTVYFRPTTVAVPVYHVHRPERTSPTRPGPIL